MMSAPEQIGVLLIGPIGDAILTTPLLNSLRMESPDSRIIAFASERNKDLFSLVPSIDDVVVFRDTWRGVFDAVKARNLKLDLYVDAKDHRSTTSRILGETLRYGVGLLTLANFPSFRNATLVPPADGPHFVDSALAPLLSLDITPPERRVPVLSTPPLQAHHDVPEILINISAGTSDRVWSLEGWSAVVRKLQSGSTTALGVGVIASPVDRARAAQLELETGARHLPTKSIVEVAGLVARSKLTITSDTSVVHLASAYNVPIVALFADRPTNVARFAPLSDLNRIVLPDVKGGSVQQIESRAVIGSISALVAEVTGTTQ